MPIKFEPRRHMPGRRAADLTVTLRKQANQVFVGLELRLSQDTQQRLRYLDGDRAVVEFDENNGSVGIERVAGERAGYKIVLGERADGRPVAYIKLTCTPEEAAQVVGEGGTKDFELFEVDGNKVTFVAKA